MAATDESVPDELSLYVGRTFTNFEDFEKLLKRRKDFLNEVLVKGNAWQPFRAKSKCTA